MRKSTKIRRRWLDEVEATGILKECVLCLCPIARSGDKFKGHLSVEHLIPTVQGGTNETSNLAPSHTGCNQRRGVLSMEWVESHRDFFNQPALTKGKIIKRSMRVKVIQ